MSPRIRKVLAIVIAASLAGGAYYFAVVKSQKGPPPVKTTGVVEGVETNIASKVPGKLVFVGFREGDRVKAGDLLAALEDADISAAFLQAEASQRTAVSSLETGKANVETSRAQHKAAEEAVNSAVANRDSADAQLKQAEKDFNRSRELLGKGIISKSDYDLAETARNTRAAELAAAKAALAQAKAQLQAAAAAVTSVKGQLATLGDKVTEAERFVDLQKANLSYTKILSPVDATVEYRSHEPGEVVAAGNTILTLIDLKSLWVRLDLQQQDVDRVKVGARAEVTLERVPGKVFEGEVFDIGREGGFAVERDVTRGRQDITSFRTRIRIKDAQGILKPGMTVLVTIPVK